MKEALVIVTPGFPADEEDTTCLPSVQQFALSVKKLYSERELIVVSFQYPFHEKTYNWHNIRVIAIGGKNSRKIGRVITWFKAYRALKKITDGYQLLGLISLWATECALVANRFAKKYHVRHLTWISGQDAKADNTYVKRIRPDASQLMAMSDFLQDEFLKNHRIKPLYVAENGINASAFPAYNSGPRPIDIFGAGSLIPLKNYTLFIELVAQLQKKHPSIKAMIAGDGKERHELQRQIDQLNLQNNITLVGLKTHPETLALMSQSKVFLHTSVYEGNSTVLMEALYSGCQVVSTRPLSHRSTEQLFVSEDKKILLAKLMELFSQQAMPQKQIIFNTMDDSAQKILKILLD